MSWERSLARGAHRLAGFRGRFSEETEAATGEWRNASCASPEPGDAPENPKNPDPTRARSNFAHFRTRQV